MQTNKKNVAWNNCKICECKEKDCHPNNHRLCGICANNHNKNYYDKRIMYGSYGDENSNYGWNVDHKTPKGIGGTNKNSNLRGTHILCNKKRGHN